MVRKPRRLDRRPPRSLIVCEPSSFLAQAVEALREAGHRVCQAASGYRAVAEQARRPADLVVIDVAPLAGRDLEVFEVLGSGRPRPFLVASLPPAARDKARRALECGADAYVVEPFDPRELPLMLRRSREQAAAADDIDSPLGNRLSQLARFAAGVAHEVNNPLTTISGWIQLALSDLDRDAPQRATFETMHEEVERIAAIVRNLLCFAGEPPANEEPIEVNDLLQDLLASCERPGVAVAVNFDEDLPLILANREQVRLAFGQIVTSAMKHIVGEGELQVATRAIDGDDAIVVEIADNGRRVAAEDLESIFDPFFSAADIGAGLGLSAAYGIIQGHGGRIDVVSREREGTRFTIGLPLHRLRHKNRILDHATG